MRFQNPLIVVKDIEKSKEFYKDTLNLNVILDFGENVTLTGGICLQTNDSWTQLIGNDDITYGSNDAELYFEEDNFDEFITKLDKIQDIEYVHRTVEHSWGQRVVRFYDPDKHIIEVGENIKMVCCRFLDSGMTSEQVAQRMDVPEKFVISAKNNIE